MAAKQNQDAFNLYKSQRDADDDIRKELSDLKAQVAINAAVRPTLSTMTMQNCLRTGLVMV